jgi:hypothetical protein
MRFRLSVIIIIMLSLLLAGSMTMKIKRGDTMTETAHPLMIDRDIPPIDKEVPAVTETATFALG